MCKVQTKSIKGPKAVQLLNLKTNLSECHVQSSKEVRQHASLDTDWEKFRAICQEN